MLQCDKIYSESSPTAPPTTSATKNDYWLLLSDFMQCWLFWIHIATARIYSQGFSNSNLNLCDFTILQSLDAKYKVKISAES